MLASPLAAPSFARTGQAAAKSADMLRIPGSQLEPLAWSALPGWAEDDHAAAFATMRKSCAVMVRHEQARSEKARDRAKARARGKAESAGEPSDRRRLRAALVRICAKAAPLGALDRSAAKAFFEENFSPVQIATLGQEEGFLTGYYEPVVEGSRFPSEKYDVPLYAPPANMLVNGRRVGEEFPNRGRVSRRIGRKKVVPFYDRGAIEDGALAGRGLEICWLKDPVDAFFLQIQGSARVNLDSGSTLRVNYAAHNGYPYTAIGRILIDRGEIPKEEMSMDRLRQWMEAHPQEAKALRRENKSYVFMREADLADHGEPIGSQGVELTPGRSIAVDHKLHVYGTMFYITAALPIDGRAPTTPFNRLMVAQDTGSAIVGPARADIYFGGGSDAAEVAGRLRHAGTFAMLVPKELDPSAVGAKMPLPLPAPPRPEAQPKQMAARVIPLPKHRPAAGSTAP